MTSLVERWDAHSEAMSEVGDLKESFAIRGDGALVIFDDEGWFLVKKDEGGTIYLESAAGRREEVYIEPIWLSGYYEGIQSNG